VIKGRVENSVLSTGVWVGENAIIRNSVVLANTSIGRNSAVSNAILDEGMVIGQNCHVGTERVFDQPNLTILGQHTRIPSDSYLRPGDEISNIREPRFDPELPELMPPRFTPALT
jgi:glucose-1-phosphate adenylyltransferase